MSAVGARLADHLPDPDREIDAAVRQLVADRARVAGLHAELGLSERQLQRRFTAAVGYGPATFLRVVRLQRARQLALANPHTGLAELAYGAGYADQAHMSREIKNLTGMTAGSCSVADPFKNHVARKPRLRSMTVNMEAARTFLRTHARIIEIRLAEFALDGVADAARGAIAGIEAYRNADGGFGHGLEPDALAPGSQPLAVDSAFGLLRDVAESTAEPAIRKLAADTAGATLDYLDAVSDPDGGLRIVLPSVAEFPHAEHWGDGNFPPALNPTAKILGAARILGLDHPWMDRATGFCRSAIAGLATGTDAHTASCAVRFLETDLDHEPSRTAYQQLLRRSDELALFKPMPGPGYGLTPLDFAPSPTSPRREFFATEAIEAHLDELGSAQLDDGGWPLTWTPPGQGPLLAWRGVVTLNALRVLHAYGRTLGPTDTPVGASADQA